jgi:hypothetical protein
MIGVWLIIGFLIGLAAAAFFTRETRPPKAPEANVIHAIGLGDQNSFSVESVNADMLNKVLAQLGAGHLFEIKR